MPNNRHPNYEEALQLIREGVSPSEVTSRLCLSTPTLIYQWLKKSGTTAIPMKKIFNDEEWSEILLAVDKGITPWALATKHNCDPTTIIKRLKKSDINWFGNQRFDQLKSEALALIESGRRVSTIAARLKVHESTIYNWCKKASVDLNACRINKEEALSKLQRNPIKTFKDYRIEVTKITRQNLRYTDVGRKILHEKYVKNYKKNPLSADYLCIDHIRSVKSGWDAGESPEIIGDILNLQLLTRSQNSVKGCSNGVK